MPSYPFAPPVVPARATGAIPSTSSFGDAASSPSSGEARTPIRADATIRHFTVLNLKNYCILQSGLRHSVSFQEGRQL